VTDQSHTIGHLPVPPRRWKQSVVPLGARSSDRQTFPAPPPPPPSCRGTWFAILSTECYYSPPQEGIFGIARSVRLSLPRRSCLRYRHLVSHCDYRFVTIGPISLAGSTFDISFSSSFRVVHTHATNNARCAQGRKTTHGLVGQHQDAARTPRERVSPNDRGQI